MYFEWTVNDKYDHNKAVQYCFIGRNVKQEHQGVNNIFSHFLSYFR